MIKEEVVEKINNNEDIYCVTKNKQIINGKTLNGCDVYIDPLYANAEWFKTLEEAEWHKEFGCIERTERLELPTWEEFKLREPYNYFIFTSKDMQYGLGIGAYYREIIINNNGSVLFQEKFTKENYTIACRKAKELFLGETK